MKEEWKDITGYEDKYQVSNLGNVKNIKNKRHIKNPTGLLSPVKMSTGYLNVSLLNENQERKEHRVHRLVATAFIPNPENKPQVNHIDNNRANNHISNLEWVTCKENLQHAQKQGRLFHAQSAGGKASSQQKSLNIDNEINNLLNTKVNGWLLLENLGVIATGKVGKRKRCVLAQCACGNKVVKPYTEIKANSGKGCNSCKTELIKATKYASVKQKLNSLKGWEACLVNYTEGANVSLLNVSLRCKNCGKTKIIKYSSLSTLKFNLNCSCIR